jgi:hypothetical protein
MLCSRCSEIVKPVVAVDIDGTLGDYHTHLIDFMQAYLGVDDSPWLEKYGFGYDGSIKMSEWANRIYGIDHKTYEQIKLAYRQGGQKRSMPLYKGVQHVTQQLRSLGVELWLTTTRPYLRLDGVDPDTRFWLDRHGIGYDGLLYDQDKYRVLAERISVERVIAVLDDLPEQYDAAAEVFGDHVPILRSTRYNRAIIRPQMTDQLAAAGMLIRNCVFEWEVKHVYEQRYCFPDSGIQSGVTDIRGAGQGTQEPVEEG